MANQQSLTIYNSFNQQLPTLVPGAAPALIAHANSHTAEATDAPKVWWERPATYWAQSGQGLLAQAYQNASLHTYVPAIERPFQFQTEADVVRATTLYLVHSVNQAINVRFNNIVLCAAEDRADGQLRCDLTWKYRTGNGWHYIAVLELKNRGVLNKQHFLIARADPNNSQQKVAAAQNRGGRSWLVLNALAVSKQAAAYALDRHTRYVALFDWDSLFLYEFRQADSRTNGVGNVAWGTWVDSNAQGITFRKVLLGWLYAACMAAGLT